MQNDSWDKIINYSKWDGVKPGTYLGDVDAETEWNHNAEYSSSIFFHTDSYEEFKDLDSLFLFGRRGTGKTAILRMLDYEINEGKKDKQGKKDKPSPYICSILIDQEDVFHNLVAEIKQSPFAELDEDQLIHFLTVKWDWIITTSAMIKIFECFGKYNIPNIDIIKEYLLKNNLLDKLTPINRIIDILDKTLKELKKGKSFLSLFKNILLDKISSPDFKNARKFFYSFLRETGKYCLVMVDSLDRLNISDRIPRSVIASLVQAIRNLYLNKQNFLLGKAVFPSEIYHHLDVFNPGKIEVKNIFIKWGYGDLLCLISKRFYTYEKKLNDSIKQIDTCDYNESKNFIYKYLPPTIINYHGIKIDTFAFILRHTQKTPRQVIILFNVILTIIDKEGINFIDITPKFLRKAIHARLDILAKESIQIYNMIYDGAYDIVRTILSHEKNIFPGSELDLLIKKASSIYERKKHSSDKIKNLLFESGSLGIVVGKQEHIQSSEKELVEALFQYQVKSFPKYPEKTICAIHPMLYQFLFNKVSKDKFVYPKPYEEEEIEVLIETGILLI
jgi:hypothetical protein